MELTQKGEVLSTASAVCGARKPVWSHYPVKGPTAPARDGLAEMSKAGRPEWTRRYSFRFAEGGLDNFPRDDGHIHSPRTLAWIADVPVRPLDFLSLAALSDAFFVRIMHARGTFQPMATVSLTTYFHVEADELAAIGATPVIGEADAAIFHNGFADQTCALWTPDGRLLANGVQITWYKE